MEALLKELAAALHSLVNILEWVFIGMGVLFVVALIAMVVMAINERNESK